VNVKPILVNAASSIAIDYYRDKHLEVYVPLRGLDAKREVSISTRVPPRDDSQYATFLVYAEASDFIAASNEDGGGETPAQRLLRTIFGFVDLEPELDNTMFAAEGGTVLVVDLDPHYPGWKLHVPAGLVG
jgi:hypothetical protein